MKNTQNWFIAHLNNEDELREIKEVISLVDAEACKTKMSEEKTTPGKILYAPKLLNNEFKKYLTKRGWKRKRIKVKTTVPEIGSTRIGYREMDAVKNRVGVEVQFGKYAFMVYNVAAKMTIFAKMSHIDAGIEIVPMQSMADQMSTGVSMFEQMKTDLEMRGEADIDIPVLILGIAPKDLETEQSRLVD